MVATGLREGLQRGSVNRMVYLLTALGNLTKIIGSETNTKSPFLSEERRGQAKISTIRMSNSTATSLLRTQKVVNHMK